MSLYIDYPRDVVIMHAVCVHHGLPAPELNWLFGLHPVHPILIGKNAEMRRAGFHFRCIAAAGARDARAAVYIHNRLLMTDDAAPCRAGDLPLPRRESAPRRRIHFSPALIPGKEKI